MEKSGQVSAFFIIGAIVIILVSIGVVFRAEISQKFSELQIIRGVALPTEAQKVNDFILQCVKDTSKTGVELLGLQGGYIELPIDEVRQGSVNQFSNKLEIVPGLKTAYWYYQKDNGISVESIPSRTVMSQQLKNYIDTNIEECFDEFSAFPEYKIDYRSVSSSVNILDDEVQVTLNMPSVVEIKGQRFNFNTFKTSIKISLGELIDVATQIVQNEIDSNFLEAKTEDMMVAYEEIPYSGSDLSCGVKTWSLEKVISDFKNILSENIPQIRVASTDYTLAEESHSYFEWDVTKKRYNNINAVLYYSESWPFYLDVIPNEDGVLKSQQITDKMGELSFMAAMFCMNDWHFVYDVKYPVLVSLYDNVNDYTFQFAMDVVIERNQPRKATIVPDFDTELDRRYCDNTRTTKSTVYTYEEMIDGSINPLADVDIKYKCINHLCDVGVTKLEEKDSVLITEFPACVGGTLIAEKEGYHKANEVDLDSNEAFSISMILEKIINKQVKIQVNRKGGGSSEPVENEQVIIELEEPEKEYKTMVIYPDQKEISLIPGDYKVKIYAIKTGESGVTIPGRDVETCVDVPKGGLLGLVGGTEQQCTTVKLPEVKLTSLTTGGAEFDWTVNKEEIYRSDYVKFYINTNPTPKTLEEVSSVNLEEKDVILPVFLNE